MCAAKQSAGPFCVYADRKYVIVHVKFAWYIIVTMCVYVNADNDSSACSMAMFL